MHTKTEEEKLTKMRARELRICEGTATLSRIPKQTFQRPEEGRRRGRNSTAPERNICMRFLIVCILYPGGTTEQYFIFDTISKKRAYLF